jgi:hypothetical protein
MIERPLACLQGDDEPMGNTNDVQSLAWPAPETLAKLAERPLNMVSAQGAPRLVRPRRCSSWPGRINRALFALAAFACSL